ncbi:MAG: S-layer homology domain-containing protein, partial [Oscillibacter sp.]
MKQTKRILSLLLAVIMSVSLLAVSASAAPTSDRETKAQVLFALGLFRGYDKTGTNFGLADGATREQAILLLIRILGEEKAADAWTGAQPYSDVPSSNYYYRYIGYAKEKGYTNGIGDNKFGLAQSANMTQMAAFALRGLGYSEAAGDFVYRNSVPFAVSLDILDSATVPAKFTRGDAVDILDGAVAANVKNQSYSLLEKLVNTGVVTQAQVEKAAAIVNAPTADIAAGTYTLKCLGNNIRVTSDKLELRNTSPAQTFTITNRDGYSYIQTADGYYVGVTKLTNGTQLVLGTTPYSWLIEKQSGSTYTIRPAEKPSMVVNACEEKSANGTKIIIWTHSGAPKNTLITFTAATKNVAVTGVKLDQTTATVAVGKSVQLTGTIAPANASN